ncbi:MAG: hypothetical protein NZM04_01280 [Methylacidiphilales bacterium]|nr:hypothetical protein [Candidatus Methylacidiphilales bacterium]MDW8349340.1 hypothetical protein [Verrucomicrobiae bacterium]
MSRFLQLFGIHPLSAFALLTVDLMLFGNDTLLGPAGWLISSLVGLALTIPVFLLQRHAYHDSTPLALSKALLLGILTAIPTALPSTITGTSGLLGLAGTLKHYLDSKNNPTPTPPPAEKTQQKNWYDVH